MKKVQMVMNHHMMDLMTRNRNKMNTKTRNQEARRAGRPKRKLHQKQTQKVNPNRNQKPKEQRIVRNTTKQNQWLKLH